MIDVERFNKKHEMFNNPFIPGNSEYLVDIIRSNIEEFKHFADTYAHELYREFKNESDGRFARFIILYWDEMYNRYKDMRSDD